MGCDIHIYVERKSGGKWYNADYFVPGINQEYVRVPIYDGRCYSLFATLANVRNYGNTAYICEPKGLPSDVTEYTESNYDEFYDHSASYLTLRELIDFHEKGHPLKHRGMISPEAQKNLENGILPETWCQGTNRKGYEFREWEEENTTLIPLIEKLKERADELNMIYSFLWDSEHEASRRKAYERSADIRIVFWFDN